MLRNYEYAYAKKPAALEKIILSGPFLSVDVWIADAERLIKTLPDGENKWVIRSMKSIMYMQKLVKIAIKGFS